MTDLKKPISRVQAGKVYEQSKYRPIVITLEPPSLLGFRAKGCRKTYYLDATACYTMAVRAHVIEQKKKKEREKQKRKRGHK